MELCITVLVAILVRTVAYLLANLIWTEIVNSKGYSRRLIRKGIELAKENLSTNEET